MKIVRCDKCGKEVEWTNCIESEYEEWNGHDLCQDCVDKYNKYIDDFIKKN
jgi:hypothetical protein